MKTPSLVFSAIAVASFATATKPTTTRTSKCDPRACVPTVTVNQHLKPSDGCTVQCSTEWCIEDRETRHLTLWLHDCQERRNQNPYVLPNGAVLVLHDRVPVHDDCGVPNIFIDAEVR
ncbi:hypothetical protein ACCO45_000626 [Purpureocillium lilacinum]|uniref:Uncharacterized protein n=1 Tax=Purpureocillium lilacinum TaxID=33203 RepID=A0ACC4E4R2_PURLI